MPLTYRPVRVVTGIKFKFAEELILDVPASWVRVTNQAGGLVQVVPSARESAQLASFALALRVFDTGYATIPGWYEITYDHGWDTDELPGNVRALWGKKAAMAALHTAGDLIVGAGIASKSVSLDGLSTSVNTTSSATNAGYGARVLALRKEIDRDLPTARLALHGMRLAFV